MMKKSLIALAIASAVSAPAFAATSNVDIYGVLNMSVDYVDPDAVGQDKSVSVTSNSSRIGFKGAEDLGGGLAAIWQLESGVNLDEQSGSFASRNSFVGLKGGFGTVLVGNHDTPMKLLGRMVDNFGDTMADSRNILGAVGDNTCTISLVSVCGGVGAPIGNGTTAFDLRTKNTVAYVSPNFSGFTFAAAYVADWSTGATGGTPAAAIDNNSADAYSINGVYSNGPLMLGAAYEAHNGLASGSNSDMWRIVGGFDIAGFKLAGLYEQIGGDVDSYNRDAYGLFGSYGMGAWNFKANYLNASESDRVGGNDGGDQWTIGADYSLSKRTTAYAYYAETSNDAAAGYGLGAGAGASDQTVGNLGSSPQVFALGVKHAF